MAGNDLRKQKCAINGGKTMTREDVLKLFPEATNEQVTELLNKNNQEVAGEKRDRKSVCRERVCSIV